MGRIKAPSTRFEFDATGEPETIQLLVCPSGFRDPRFSGAVSVFNAGVARNWMLAADPDKADPTLVAELLSLHLINAELPVLHPSIMPPLPPVATLSPDGLWLHSRNKVFAPWILQEIGRLAAELLANHRDYLEAVALTIRGRPQAGFVEPPPGVALQDEKRRLFLAPPPPRPTVDLSQSEARGKKMAWYQVWNQDYRRNRYLAGVPKEVIEQRIADITLNTSLLDDQGRHTFKAEDPVLYYWLARLSEAATEFQLRYGPYPAGFGPGIGAKLRLASREVLTKRAVAAVNRVGQPSAPFLIKYGKREFVEAAHREGRIRISPASYYRDPSLNAAIHDDELSATVEVQLNARDYPREFAAALPYLSGPPPFRAAVTKKYPTNYYVYCLSGTFNARLFFDFEADACLIVRDPESFLDRVLKAMKARFPGWTESAEAVTYYDPFNVSAQEIDVLHWKHFRYAYQAEVRFAWVPPSPIEQLQPVDLELGTLNDIAEIVIA